MTLEIIHLKQIHASPSLPDYDEEHYLTLSVVRTQLEIAKYLLLNPNIPVVVENLIKNTVSEASNEDKLVFPNGLPSELKQLTSIQKTAFYKFGSALTLTYDGSLQIIYKSIDRSNAERIKSEYSKMSIHEFNTQGEREEDPLNRENFALDNAEIAAELHYGQPNEGKVIIIFGVHHDFKKECLERGHKLIEVVVDAVQEYLEWQGGLHNSLSSVNIAGDNGTIPDL